VWLVALLGVAGCRNERAVPPSSTPDRAAPVDTAPYTILAPVPGALWYEGSRHIIRWQSRRAGPVNIGAVMGGKDRGHLAMSIPAGIDSLVWQIPTGFVSGFGLTRSDAVRLRVEASDSPALGVESAPFTIAAP
jgi:hypothetical protein